jgi:ADP-sugar diphosphatase
MFGPRVGFVKFHATVHKPPLAAPLPGIVFMRGGSVGVLVVLQCEGERHVLLTSQARVPIASSAFLEIPAGMLDGDGNFAGVAAKEMEEETGIVIRTGNLIDLTERAYGDSFPGVYPSCGGSDEFIRLFLYKEKVERARLEELRGRLGGLVDHGEAITLQVVRLEDVWRVTSDCKTLSALILYEKLRLE